MTKMLTCQVPGCNRALFIARLVSGKDNDTRMYMELTCTQHVAPQNQMLFVVDLTPEFERAL